MMNFAFGFVTGALVTFIVLCVWALNESRKEEKK